MIIKEAKYKNVKVMQRKCVSETVYGCDECKKEIPKFPNESSRLDLTIFHNSGETEHLHFCSWRCVLKHVPKIKSDYFVTLPMLYFDQGTKNRTAKDFIKIIKKLN